MQKYRALIFRACSIFATGICRGLVLLGHFIISGAEMPRSTRYLELFCTLYYFVEDVGDATNAAAPRRAYHMLADIDDLASMS